MTKTKDRPALASDALRPYVTRALQDPELRDDLIAAFAAARSLYEQVGKERSMKKKAAKISGREFQDEIQDLVAELSSAADRIQGGKGKKRNKSHKGRKRVVLLTGVTLGVLYNPWTGAATREWIMTRVAGGNGDGFDQLSEELSAESGTIPATAEDTEA